ncbi:MAG: T9SS type A sorting domain-containing protein [Bacteroidota bacterium]|nr:T9SS type A sorting domain-containing protein [Bacteroidota bacterium]
MKSFLSILILIIFFTHTGFTQNLVQKFDGINFNVRGNNATAPFNGGINNARFQYVDIDGDNDLDLFMFDADTTLYFYKNNGTPQNASFQLLSTRFQNLTFKNWFYFTDIDSDFDYDLFTGGDLQTIKYYKNTGTPVNASLSLIVEELRTFSDTVIYSEANCVPVFCDIDNDGDKDFFTGQSLGTITYYENIGSSGNFSYKYITDIWQNLLIISPAFRTVLQPDSKFFSFEQNKSASLHEHNYKILIEDFDGNRHGANSLEFADIDNDNDFDLFWGDLFSKGIYFIKNNGTPSVPDAAIEDSIYPRNSPYISKGYNSTRFVDIDADGDKDLFVSVLYLSQNSNNFAFYRNEGNAFTPDYHLISGDYLNNVDVGGNSNIRFVDIDNDGDKDLFMGCDYAKLAYYQNTGTVTYPSFNLITDSLPILSSSFNYAPAFEDLDNDGDKDLLLGSYIKDSLWFFRNTGTASNFNFILEGRGYQINLDTLGQSSNPTFIDIDNDNDKDLFIGATNGRIFFYENTGTASNFIFTFRTAYYNSIDVGNESIPRFFDIDSDGDYDLFIGEEFGKISYYKNEGSPASANFILQTNNYKNINVNQNSCPEFTDIDNDTDLDLFIGNSKGGMFYFRNDDIVEIQNISNTIPAGFKLYQNYPNPFNPTTKIKFELPNSSFIKLSVFDVSGKEIALLVNEKLNAGIYEYSWNASNLSSGIYFYKLSSESFTENRKMLYIK